MSEIFDWMKRNELEDRKSLVALPEVLDVHRGDSVVSFNRPPQPEVDTPEPSRAAKLFDLDNANPQIKCVLNPSTMVGEQYRLLRAKLSLMKQQRGIRTLLITSSVPGEGKTFSSCCLAAILAHEPGKRALLVDADLRKPKTGYNLGLENPGQFKGLSEVLVGSARMEEAIIGFKNMGLFLLPSGAIPPNPVDLLSSASLEQTIKRSAEMYDWVIVDSPPNLTLADPSLLARYCDAVLLVIRAEHTPSRLAIETIERLGREKICGAILNRVRNVHSSRYYYGYYVQDKKAPAKK
jgi:protein-tyrosine kinase